jgi:ABC-2 type transport system ATP-binding protein
MSIIVAHGLTKRFGGLTAVDNLSFEIDEGEVFGLLGPNGAGKTTTIRLLACLLIPTKGEAEIFGYSIWRDQLRIREITGILTENPCLYERLTAYENMEFFAEAYNITDPRERSIRIRELLEFFGLWDRRHDKVGKFSKGMKQKLAIARALVHRPPILYLDEPTSDLDPESSKAIRDLIKKLSEREQCTILLSTHRLEDAEKLCNKVMIIKEGRRIALGSPSQLSMMVNEYNILEIRLRHPLNKVEDILGEINGVDRVEIGKTVIRVETKRDVEEVTPTIVRHIVEAGGEVLSVTPIRPSLEDAYLKLVKEDGDKA